MRAPPTDGAADGRLFQIALRTRGDETPRDVPSVADVPLRTNQKTAGINPGTSEGTNRGTEGDKVCR